MMHLLARMLPAIECGGALCCAVVAVWAWSATSRVCVLALDCVCLGCCEDRREGMGRALYCDSTMIAVGLSA